MIHTVFVAAGPQKQTLHGQGGNDIDKLFKHIFSEQNLFSTIPHSVWTPPTDVYETPSHYVVRMEVPGIEETDIDIELNHNVLTIRGNRRDKCSDTKLGFHQMEIHFGYFERVITLPHSIDPNVPPATYNDGFLCITIGKSPARRAVRRHIEIE